MDVKDILKWGLLAVIGFLAFRWAGSAISGFLSGGLDVDNGGLDNAPYMAPLTGYQVVYPWAPPWQRGRWGPGKRRGGPGPYPRGSR
jgi:hypothetical protein